MFVGPQQVSGSTVGGRNAPQTRFVHWASDQAMSVNSCYLYARNVLAGTISAFRVDQTDGALTPIQTIVGLPLGGAAISIAAR